MFRKAIISMVFVGLLLVVASVATMAQLAPVSGRVVVETAGKQVGVAGALVEVYRTDIKATLPSAKTDKNGNFAFAGLPLGGAFVLSVSGPNIQAQIFPNVKAGADQMTLIVAAGNGEKFTEAQVRQGAANSASGNVELTAEQKKQQAEYDAKKKDVDEKNSKIQKSTEIIKASFAAGNDAYKAKNWDVAIQQYDQGIAADPEFIGSVPAMSNNRGLAYMSKALDERNKAVQETDATAKTDGLGKAKHDLDEAINSFTRAWTMLKNAAPSDELPKANLDAGKMGALTGVRDTLGLAARTELVDDAMMNAAKTIIPDYLAIETDQPKKTQTLLTVADLSRVNGDYQAAIDGYKKVLETAPDNPDALAMIGVCYYALGASNNSDKAMYQEGANYLQKYLSVAPDGHKYKKDVADILDALKKENVTPQKLPATAPAKKRGGVN